MDHDRIPERLTKAFPKTVNFSQGRSGETSRFVSKTLSSEAFIERVTTHREGEKQGSAWSPFHFRNDTRQSANCIGADVLVLDIDDGTSDAEVVRALRQNMRAALVVSSHSHFATRTDFRKSEYDAWRESHPRADEEDFMRTRDKGYREAAWRGSSIVRGEDGEPIVKAFDETDAASKKITIEHEPCRKFRIIVPLAEAFRVADFVSLAETADAWRRMCLALAEELGLNTDPNALLLTQLFFDPRHPSGFEPVVRHVSGWPFNAAAALARNVGKKARPAVFAPQQSRPQDETKRNPFVRGGECDYGAVRGAVMAIRNDERFNARPTWLQVMGALHHATHGSAEGLEIAQEWCATSTRQDDNPSENERTWRSLQDYRANNANAASLLWLAKKDGWLPPEWMEAQIVMSDERPDSQIIELLNNEFAVIRNKGSVRILCEGTDAEGLATFDLLSEKDFLLLTKNLGVVTTQAPGGKKRVVDGNVHWLRSQQRREFRGLVFHPGDVLQSEPGSNGPPAFFNFWRAWGVDPNRRGSCNLFKEHLFENVCRGDSDLYSWLLDWMAHLFQRPREKPGVAVVMRGKKGTGKSIVGKTLGALVGPRHYFVASQQEQLVGKFNAQLANALLIQAEQAFFSRDPKAWGALKDLITRETRTIEPKGVDASLVDAYDRLVITSNEDAVIPAEPGERRYAVFDVADAHARDTAFFAALENELKANGGSGYGRLIWELMQRDLRGFDCRKAPETAALAEQKLHNLKPVARWMLARLQDGWFWKVRDNEERRIDFDQTESQDATDDNDAPNERVGKETVRANYLQYSRDMNDRYPMDERDLGKWLVENVGFRPAQRRCKTERCSGNAVRRKGEREHCYRIPPPAAARARFIENFELPQTIFDELDGEMD